PAELRAWLRKQLGSMIGSLNEENQALKNLDKQAGKAKEALENLQRAQRLGELPWGSYLREVALLSWVGFTFLLTIPIVGIASAFALLVQVVVPILALLGISGLLSVVIVICNTADERWDAARHLVCVRNSIDETYIALALN